MLLAVQIAKYLHEQGLGLFSENDHLGNVFIDSMPAGENLICIYNRAGRKSDSRKEYRYSGIQIIFKGNNNSMESMREAEEINNALHGFSGLFTLQGNEIISCLNQQGGAYSLGVNNEGKHEYTMNFQIELKI